MYEESLLISDLPRNMKLERHSKGRNCGPTRSDALTRSGSEGARLNKHKPESLQNILSLPNKQAVTKLAHFILQGIHVY